MSTLNAFLAGATMVNAWVVSMFFLRFWQKTREPLFSFFAWAFFLLGMERISVAVFSHEVLPWAYLIRLAAFLLILTGILTKNARKKHPPGDKDRLLNERLNVLIR
jgi:hypothetical protein